MHIRTRDEDWAHIREVWLDDETRASSLAVIDYRMRIGTAEVAMAGIGGVQTEREHRMQGHARRLLENTVLYMAAGGYDVSMLFGIENFYIKFGYASCLPAYHFVVKTRDAEVAQADALPYQARPIEAEDMPAVVALYNADNATRTCSIIRSPERFTEFSKGTQYGATPETMLWEADGDLVAYAMWDKYPKAVKVAELAARDRKVFPAILGALAEQAVGKRCEDIAFYMPPDHAFAEYAQRFGTEWTVRYPRYGGGMMRICNQLPLFEKLAPELERRLAASVLAGYTGTVSLLTDLGRVTLTFDAGKLSVDERPAAAVLEISQDKLMQLVVGYRSLQDVCLDNAVHLEGNGAPLLNVLFPKVYAYPWLADHF